MGAGAGPDRNGKKSPILPQQTKLGDVKVRHEMMTSLDELDWFGPEDVHPARHREQGTWGKP